MLNALLNALDSKVKYIELHKISFDEWYLEKNIDLLKERYSVDAPDSVIEQFYLDHNNDDMFKSLYGDLDILKLKWSLIDVETERFLQIDKAASYPDFLEETSEDASHFDERGEKAIAHINEDLEYWKTYGSWSVPPIFINGHMLSNPTTDFHLVEGHIRVGSLRGINKYKLLKITKMHKVYFGSY